MGTLVQVSDEVLGAGTYQWQLDVSDERMTVRELIRSRVYQEVQDANLQRRNQHQLLIDLAQKRRSAQPDRLGSIDWTEHYAAALAAYSAGKFLLLVADHQTESLDELVHLTEGVQVTFLKLIPLVGG